MAAGSALEQEVDVETPEQVVVSYTIAGIGTRVAAALIDYAICALGAIGIGLAARPFLARRTWTSAWIVAGLILLQFVVLWGYYVLWEALWDGQTPGKRRLGLRVVRDGGYSITFAASAVRNLLRVIDLQPLPTYGVGILSIVLSRAGKRVGDIAAGTMVVSERAVAVAVDAPPGAVTGAASGLVTGSAAAPPTAGQPLAGPAGPPPATALTDDEFHLLDRFIARRSALASDRRAAFAAQLAARFRERVPALTGSDAAVLVQLHAQEQAARARGVAGRSDTGAAREQHAIVARGAPRWREFAALLAQAQRRGLAGLGEREVSDFVSRYRELAGDLARLQTAARGRQVDALFTLSRLVAAGHNLLYRDRRVGWHTVWEYMTIEVPREIRRSALPIALAASLLFGPAAIGYVAVVTHPALAPQLVGTAMVDRAEQGVEWARRGEGYIPDFKERRPLVASFVARNNIQVSIIAFAGGLLVGLGTMAALVFNGIEFGAVLGLYRSKGILSLILAFVAPHGVLEMSAITIAGAGGLLLASAIVLPGATTRREALIARGRRAITLLAGTALLLLVAGALEGLVSPIPWWTLGQKLAVSALTAVLLALYVNMDRGRTIGRDVGAPHAA